MSNQHPDLTPSLRTILPYGTGVHYPSQAVQNIFQEMASADYVLMWLLFKHAKDTGSEKIYFKDLAQALHLPEGRVSKVARDLQRKGYVLWTHDGDGQEGTYLQLTDSARESAQAQHALLADFNQRVMKAYGEEDFIDLLGQIARLESIIEQEAEKAGETYAAPTP